MTLKLKNSNSSSIVKDITALPEYFSTVAEVLRGSTTQNGLIFQFCLFFMLKIKLYVCRNLCENFRQIGQKMKKL